MRTRPEFAVRLPDEIRFPVDAVYTWADGADPRWHERRARPAGHGDHERAADETRPWTTTRCATRCARCTSTPLGAPRLPGDGPPGTGLADPRPPGLTVVGHSEIFDDPSALPTFNPHAVETRLHHVHGLSEHFLYLNDDVFLGSPVTPQDFFLPSGTTKFFLSRALVPHGAPTPTTSRWRRPGRTTGRCWRAGSARPHPAAEAHPHALRRSVLAEIEREFPGPYRATMTSRVRGASDISVPPRCTTTTPT
ncbi:stealth conserved region 3 domain-containing protein [Streptomyces sp. M19]